MQDPTPL